MKKILSWICWYLPVGLVQLLASNVTMGSLFPWYGTLKKGPLTPPDWVFGPTWSLLYLMMATAVWLVYQAPAPSEQKKPAYILFFAQLILNGLWSFVFFGMHELGWSVVNLAILVILIALTMLSFYQIRKLAGILLIPYLFWCTYALYLNAATWYLN